MPSAAEVVVVAALGAAPVAVRFIGFLRTRSAMELVNGVAGILQGIALLGPRQMLTQSRALGSLLELMPEYIWGGILLSCGVLTFLAWRCRMHRCRSAVMLLWCFGWGFLSWNSFLGSGGESLFFGVSTALMLGCALAYWRIHEARESVDGPG